MRALIVTGTRADFGLWKPVLAEIQRRPADVLRAQLLVTGMHLDPRFGSTIDEVRASGTEIVAEIPCTPDGDSRTDMVVSLADVIRDMAPILRDATPDWLLLLGDRGEQLAAGLVAMHQGVAVAHVHGGERSLGAVDDTIRDMISRIAHVHCAAEPSAADRLERLGEASWRIHVTGAPGLDDLSAGDTPSRAAVRRALGVGDGPYAVVLYHPETVGVTDPVATLSAVLHAVRESDLNAVALLPNSDAGGRSIRDALMSRAHELTAVFASLPREEYMALLSGAEVLVGNSSSGLIEAPHLRLPVVNVGDRQRGRLQGDNVVNVTGDKVAIRRGISAATSPSFRSGLSGTSPYGTGHAAIRIVDALLAHPIDSRLLIKEVA